MQIPFSNKWQALKCYLDTHKRRWLRWAAILGPAAFALWAILDYFMPRDDVHLVSRRNIQIQIASLGRLDAGRSTMMLSSLRGDRGRVIWLIADGATVKQGDPVVRFDPTPIEDEIKKLEIELMQFESILDGQAKKSQLEVSMAERELLNAEVDLKVARLELKNYVEGEGLIQKTDYASKANDADQALEAQQHYLDELRKLESEGFLNPIEVQQAEKRLVELHLESEQKRLDYGNFVDRIFPTRIETFHLKISKLELDLERTQRETAIKIAQGQVERLELEKTLELKKADLLETQKQLTDCVLRAPTDGLVVLREDFRQGERRKPRVGDVIIQGQPVAYIPDITSMIVETSVRENELKRIAPGTPCSIAINAFPDMRLHGFVQTIGVLAEEDPARVKRFRVSTSIEGNHETLRPGMSVLVTFLSKHHDNALSIPASSVFFDSETTWCYVRYLGRFHKRSITLRDNNHDWAIIDSGLKPGERVAIIHPERKQIGWF